MQRSRALAAAEHEALSRTLAQEVGEPIAPAHNELDGLLPRCGFFVEQAEAVVRDEAVNADASLPELTQHVPLGVLAKVQAWRSYPGFVGCSVVVPALLTGHAVLYKPSEHATSSGPHVARRLHEA